MKNKIFRYSIVFVIAAIVSFTLSMNVFSQDYLTKSSKAIAPLAKQLWNDISDNKWLENNIKVSVNANFITNKNGKITKITVTTAEGQEILSTSAENLLKAISNQGVFRMLGNASKFTATLSITNKKSNFTLTCVAKDSKTAKSMKNTINTMLIFTKAMSAKNKKLAHNTVLLENTSVSRKGNNVNINVSLSHSETVKLIKSLR